MAMMPKRPKTKPTWALNYLIQNARSRNELNPQRTGVELDIQKLIAEALEPPRFILKNLSRSCSRNDTICEYSFLFVFFLPFYLRRR